MIFIFESISFYYRIDPVLLASPIQQTQHKTTTATTKITPQPKQQNTTTAKGSSFNNDDTQDTLSLPHSPKQNREDQLFEIINELIKAKRKRKSKTKRLRLFDIIDNIPVTSEEESESEIYRKQSLKNDNIENPDAENRTLFNYGLTSFPTIKSKQEQLSKTAKRQQDGSSFPSIPGPSNLVRPITNSKTEKQKATNASHNNNEASDSWVALINTVNQNLQDRDNLITGVDQDSQSWLNLKRATRHENKETQTRKTKKTEDQYRTIEIQTELQDMIEIPRSQTFFTEPSNKKENIKKTAEFCDRVRQEVLQKLQYQESLEDKHVQTICHAEVQTDEGAVNNKKDCESMALKVESENEKVWPWSKTVFFRPLSIFLVLISLNYHFGNNSLVTLVIMNSQVSF